MSPFLFCLFQFDVGGLHLCVSVGRGHAPSLPLPVYSSPPPSPTFNKHTAEWRDADRIPLASHRSADVVVALQPPLKSLLHLTDMRFDVWFPPLIPIFTRNLSATLRVRAPT